MLPLSVIVIFLLFGIPTLFLITTYSCYRYNRYKNLNKIQLLTYGTFFERSKSINIEPYYDTFFERSKIIN